MGFGPSNLVATGGGTRDHTIRFWNLLDGSAYYTLDTQSQVGSTCSLPFFQNLGHWHSLQQSSWRNDYQSWRTKVGCSRLASRVEQDQEIRAERGTEQRRGRTSACTLPESLRRVRIIRQPGVDFTLMNQSYSFRMNQSEFGTFGNWMNRCGNKRKKM